jgi:putative endonuclease
MTAESVPDERRRFWVYVLVSQKTGRRYVGSTQDVTKRLRQHNAGHSKSTRHGVPWRLVKTESFLTRAEAVQRERFLKTGQGRRELDAELG